VEATGPAGKAVTFSATATDLVSGTVAVTYWIGASQVLSGSVFPVTAAPVTVTARAVDAAGNVSLKTFTIWVRDTTPPTITGVVSLITVSAGAGSSVAVTFPVITASDIVSGVVPVTFSKASGSLFALGLTQVTVTAVDAAGNVVTKTFWVLVTH
jgi:hypothetical protein